MADFVDRFGKVPLSQRVLALLLVMATLFIAYYMLLYSPLEDQIVAEQDEQARLSQDRVRLQSLRDRLAALQEEVDEETRRREGLTVPLPTVEDIPALLNEIHETAEGIATSSRGTKLEIREVRREPYVAGADYARIPLQLRLTGTYDQVIDFCWALARMQRIVHVRQVNMAVSSGTERNAGGPPVLQVDLGIEAFFRPEG